MKFIELLNGDLLNLDEVKKLYWTEKQYKNLGKCYYSHMEDKSGVEHGFLDIPPSFNIEIEGKGDQQVDITYEHVNILHQIALSFIISHYKDGVISQELIDQDVWPMFIKAVSLKIKEDQKND